MQVLLLAELFLLVQYLKQIAYPLGILVVFSRLYGAVLLALTLTTQILEGNARYLFYQVQ
jgi:hypothetical protein